jgi:DnaJ-domain-containing protein 1
MHATATADGGPQQHLRALERANEVRLARADLKRRIADGQLRAADVILTSPWEVESMSVADLLMSQRRWGQTRVRRLLAGIPLSETKTLGSMTERQRLAVASAMRDAAPERPPANVRARELTRA